VTSFPSRMADDAARSLAEHRALAEQAESLLPTAQAIAQRLIETYEAGGRLYSFGNGGSSCDAQHLAEELIARYRRDRRPLAAMSLSADASVLTCIANDYGFDEVFARQVRGLACPGDMVVGFTTSGRSPNVVRGLAAARDLGCTTVLFGGGDGRPALDHADYALVVPSTSTARVQEIHVLLLHVLLDPVDAWAAGQV
jgi:D-sedoheptulose 7-phosphate isomerase